MNLLVRPIAAAALAFCPLLMHAQNQDLPSAPSAIAAQRGFELAQETTFRFTPSQPSFASPSRVTTGQKFNAFIDRSFSPYTTFSSAVAASLHPSWNNAQSQEAYASRMGTAMADQTRQGFFTHFLLPTMFHEDPRYAPSHETSTIGRFGYALSRLVIGRTDSGKPTVNASELLGSVLAASLQAYRPIRRPGADYIASRAASSIGSDAGFNVLREFWPDIRSHFMDHGPKMVQNLVTRMGPRWDGTAPPAN